MIYGMYMSAQGAEAQTQRQDTIANNLANASTTGFKRSLAVFQAHKTYDVERGFDRYSPYDVNTQSGGLSLAEVAIDYSNGDLQKTNSPLHVAMTGPGFLQVTDGKQQFLTRDGNLEVDPQGRIVTSDRKLAVLGTAGPLTANVEAGALEIGNDGTITQAGGTIPVGKLAFVEPAKYSELERLGGNLYSFQGRLKETGPQTQVRQGFLEASGVKPVLEMMDLIESARVFEANINMIKFQDDSVDRLLTSLPRK